MRRQVVWALVAARPEDIEKLPLGGTLPAIANKPWRRLDVVTEDREKRFHVFIFQGKTIPRGFGLPPERVGLEGDVVELRGVNARVHMEQTGEDLIRALPLTREAVVDLEPRLLVGFEDVEALATGVHAALLLESGAMEVASLESEGAVASLGRFLLQIDAPSFFLTERWEGDGLPVYRHTSRANLWIRLGWRHPWEKWFEQPGFLAPSSAEQITLIEPHAWWSVSRRAFRDIFEGIDLLPPGADEVSWIPSESAPRFKVPLRWGTRAVSRDAALWLLSEDDLGRLEDLLGLLPDTDIGNLQIAFLRDEDGEECFVVREIIGGRSRKHLNFGQGFSSYAGFSNLFTPTDRLLEPPIRRDQYARLFELSSGQTTLLKPIGREPREGMQVVRFSEGSFRPLTSLIDYLVQGAKRVLEDALGRSILELGSLATLPSRPAAASPKPPPLPKRRRPPKAAPDAEPDVAPEQETAPEPKKGTPKRRKTREVEAIEVEEKAPELKEEETRERDAVAAFEDPAAWSELANVKRLSGRFEMAVACLEHALWLSTDEDAAELWQALQRALLQAGEKGALTRGLQARASVLAFIADAPELEPMALARRLPDVVKRLREAAPQLSKKARWFLWTRALRWTNDRVEIVHLRETLLGELSMRGVSEIDSFPFVRRHLRDRQGSEEISPKLRGFLSMLSEGVARIEQKAMVLEVVGSLAMGLEIAGDSEAATHTLQQWRRRLDGLPKGEGAVAYASFGAVSARLGQGDAESLFDQSLQRLAGMKPGYLKDCVLIDVLQQIQHATLLSAEERLVGEVMRQIGEQEPVRQCLQLKDCAELLLDLGGAGAVAERVEQLLEDNKVREDLYSLEHALQALITCQSGRPPEPKLAERIFSSLLELDEPLDDSGIRALDYAVGALGSGVFAVLRKTAKERDAVTGLMLKSCVVRGLADSAQTDAGLALLKELFEETWKLKSNAELTRALCRLVPNVSHLGRADEGVSLIRGVLAGVDGRKGNQQLDLRERGQILASCARAVGRLGEHNEAIILLDRMITAFEAMIGDRLQGVSHLFEFLGQIVDEVISIGEIERGAELLGRAVRAIQRRLDGRESGDHPYFVHQARIKCAVAMLTLDQRERGLELLRVSIDDVAQVRMFDGRDRVDLLLDAMRAVALAQMEEATRVDLLVQLINTGMGNEASGSYNDVFRRDLLRGAVQEVIQRHAAYRLEVKKIRALEERLIRARVVSSRDLSF